MCCRTGGVTVNALWLCLGTLTRIPVPMPTRVDARVGGWSLVLSPIGGLVLGLGAAAPWALADVAGVNATPVLQAVLMVAAVAWLTRGMHLDGLADTADGLGSGKPAEQALAIMKESDIGPFGVITVLLVLLAQVAAIGQLIALLGPTRALEIFVLCLVVSRGVLVLVGTKLYPPARSDGLGRGVAGTVTGPMTVLGMLLMAFVVAAILLLAAERGLTSDASAWLVAAVLIGLLAGVVRTITVRDRLGGMTGDVFGDAVEVTFTATLIVAALGLAA